jgi:hypothetical protein
MAVNRRWLYLLASSLIIAITMSMAARGLLTGYSYWLDEILSVSGSLSSWQKLYANYALGADVNPPLYLSVLKIWIGVVGDSEIATRLLSLGFAGLTLLILAYEACRRMQLRWLVALILMGLSPAFSYFSQETRTYSMTLALATLVTISALTLRQKRLIDPLATPSRAWSATYYITCLALSLAHYFGWIYVFVLVIINYFERLVEPVRFRTLCLLAIISVWPAWYVFASDIGGKVGGGSLAKPFIGPIRDYLNGSIPALSIEVPTYQYLFTWGLLAAIALLALDKAQRLRMLLTHSGKGLDQSSQDSSYLIRIICTFLLIIVFINLRTAMSLSRYYIVLLPATILLVSNAIAGLSNSDNNPDGMRKTAALVILAVLSYSLGMQSYKEVSVKIAPAQNWKKFTESVVTNEVCNPHCIIIGSHGLHPYYFNKYNIFPGRLIDLSRPQQSGRPEPSLEEQAKKARQWPDVPILGFHHAKEVLPLLIDEQKVCLQPVQWRLNTTFVILPANHHSLSKRKWKDFSICS